MLCIMRTTVALDDHVLAAAKRQARRRHLTLGQFVEEALRRELARSKEVQQPTELPVFTRGTGLLPGIDGTSNRSMLEAMDEGVPLETLR